MLIKMIYLPLLKAILILCICNNLLIADESSPKIHLGGKTFNVEIADTNKTRALGLSGRESLPHNQGMLFVFDQDGGHPIWMKGMRFELDIIWINRFGKVVHIERQVHPDTYPRAFLSHIAAKYALEIVAGGGEGISLGDLAYFEGIKTRAH